jgi:hypothetical protein
VQVRDAAQIDGGPIVDRKPGAQPGDGIGRQQRDDRQPIEPAVHRGDLGCLTGLLRCLEKPR